MKWNFICFLLLFFSCNERKVKNEMPNATDKEKAFSLYNDKKYLEAIPYLSTIIRNDSTNGEYFFKRANCYSRLREKDKALQDNLRAVKLNYRKDAAFFNIGLDYLFVNDSLAKYYFEKCLIENPKDDKAHILLEQLKKRNPHLFNNK